MQDFAAGLRRLREQAGLPDYRSMARRAGCAHSTLSTAAAGRKLPTLETTLAFVRACGADEEDQARWAGRWKRARADLDREHDTGPAPGPALPPPASPPPRSWWRGRWGAVLAVGAGAALAAGISAGALPGADSDPVTAGGARPLVHRSATAAQPPAVTPEPERRHGPLVMVPGRVVDLDSLAPDWNVRTSPGFPHHDMEFTDSDHLLTGLGNADMAVLPAGDVGRFDECAREQHYGVELRAPAIRPGVLLCDITSEDRVAMLRVTDVQRDPTGTPDQVTFDVVVWVRLHQK
ncbi:helix-turn-helix domain-containing protein [Streptomyces sp. NPDC101152]|uniref:helix-turn-helix domain-containing protein n=1 Tax=Streptomyces sp. NPDC101152 TaxID=3366116 RepID=UPI00380ABAD2